jgi:drug/metabolite transporter (DMT)-like permease
LLGVLYAALGAFTFALNYATMRRGVVTGSVLQGMALTVPIGGISFLLMTIAFGELDQLLVFPIAALTWLAAQGIVHFVIGRYCNYKSNQLMGVNLAAPVIQLQVPFAMMLAVVMLHEKFTVLQAIGSALMLGGAFTTQANASNSKNRASTPRAQHRSRRLNRTRSTNPLSGHKCSRGTSSPSPRRRVMAAHP